MEYEKTDDNRLIVRRQETVEETHELGELKACLHMLQVQKVRDIERADLEIAAFQNLIAEAERLGVVDAREAAALAAAAEAKPEEAEEAKS